MTQTERNEWYVSVKKIQRLLDEGHTERDVALIWNGSLCGSEEPVEKRGVNSHGIAYDTPHYARLVLTAYAQEHYEN